MFVTVGQKDGDYVIKSWTELNNIHNDTVTNGGEYIPSSCLPQQRIAIIIPYKTRQDSLKVLLNNLHPYLQRQQLHYRIFVMEPVSQSFSYNNLYYSCDDSKLHYLYLLRNNKLHIVYIIMVLCATLPIRMKIKQCLLF